MLDFDDVGQLIALGRLDTSPKKNWVEKAGGLPKFIEDIALALVREGKDKSSAVAIAISRCKAWAAGGDDVKPDTRAKAAKAIAEWTALKAKNKSKRVAASAVTPDTELVLELSGVSFNVDRVRAAWEAVERARRAAQREARRHQGGLSTDAAEGILMDDDYRYVRETWSDFLIVGSGPDAVGRLWKVPFSVGYDGEVQFAPEIEVKVDYTVNASDVPGVSPQPSVGGMAFSNPTPSPLEVLALTLRGRDTTNDASETTTKAMQTLAKRLVRAAAEVDRGNTDSPLDEEKSGQAQALRQAAGLAEVATSATTLTEMLNEAAATAREDYEVNPYDLRAKGLASGFTKAAAAVNSGVVRLSDLTPSDEQLLELARLTRRVRTAAGAKLFNQPIGSVITAEKLNSIRRTAGEAAVRQATMPSAPKGPKAPKAASKLADALAKHKANPSAANGDWRPKPGQNLSQRTDELWAKGQAGRAGEKPEAKQGTTAADRKALAAKAQAAPNYASVRPGKDTQSTHASNLKPGDVFYDNGWDGLTDPYTVVRVEKAGDDPDDVDVFAVDAEGRDKIISFSYDHSAQIEKLKAAETSSDEPPKAGTFNGMDLPSAKPTDLKPGTVFYDDGGEVFEGPFTVKASETLPNGQVQVEVEGPNGKETLTFNSSRALKLWKAGASKKG